MIDTIFSIESILGIFGELVIGAFVTGIVLGVVGTIGGIVFMFGVAIGGTIPG